MDFRIPCQCGQHVLVTEGSAGATVPCPCGRTLAVPSLKELRLQVGLSPYELSPELVIEGLLASGEWLPNKTCAQCNTDTADIIQIMVECERSWSRSSGTSWPALVLACLISPWVLLFRERNEEKVYGKDKVLWLPLAVCMPCQINLRRSKVIKECLRKVPEYRQLLDKFPNARVSFPKKPSFISKMSSL
jgi:hypothetical protein